MWFERDIRRSLEESRDAIQVLRGPRQCGKSSLLLRIDDRFREVSLDDPGLRDYAQRDPELFLRSFGDDALLIDEAQYAPALKSEVLVGAKQLCNDEVLEQVPCCGEVRVVCADVYTCNLHA